MNGLSLKPDKPVFRRHTGQCNQSGSIVNNFWWIESVRKTAGMLCFGAIYITFSAISVWIWNKSDLDVSFCISALKSGCH